MEENNILNMDDDLPLNQDELCAVATDDILFFHKRKKQGLKILSKLDEVFSRQGVVKNAAKDIMLASFMTGLGYDISSSAASVEPSSCKLANIVLCLCDLLSSPRCSPNALNSVLGVFH